MKVIVELTGGLANQLFQWATGQLLATDHGAQLILDCRVPDRPWERGLQIDYFIPDVDVRHSSAAARIWWQFVARAGRLPAAAAKRAAMGLPREGTVVRSVKDAQECLLQGRSIRMRGLFQDAHWLFERRSEVLSTILPGLQSLQSISKLPASPYAAIHVRRGDYVAVPKYAESFGVCEAEYFARSVQLLDGNLPIYVASDDHEWVQNELTSLNPRIELYRGDDLFQDLAMLAKASQLILSNSTFSWWAAYLGDHHKVICPEPWFNDAKQDQQIEHPSWLRVPR